MQVQPLSASLYGGAAIVQVVAGPQTQDFTLSAPQPLPNSITLTTASGSQSGGSPVLYWDAPFQLTVPPLAPLPARGKPNTAILTTVSVALRTAGTGQMVLGSTLTHIVYYDASASPTLGLAHGVPLAGSVVPGFNFTLGGVATGDPTTLTAVTGGELVNATPLLAQSAGLQERAHGALTLTVSSTRQAFQLGVTPTASTADEFLTMSRS